MLDTPSPDRDPLQMTTRRSAGTSTRAAEVVDGSKGGTAAGEARAALHGCRIGLICRSRQTPAAALFLQAAESLGAQVSVLHAADVADVAGAAQAGSGQQDKLLNMLARLYDLIECQDLPPAVIRRIADQVAVPVLADLGGSALRAGGATADAVAARHAQPDGTTDKREGPAWEQGLTRVRQALAGSL